MVNVIVWPFLMVTLFETDFMTGIITSGIEFSGKVWNPTTDESFGDIVLELVEGLPG